MPTAVEESPKATLTIHDSAAVDHDVSQQTSSTRSAAAAAPDVDKGWLCREMMADLARRRPHYISDWTDGLHLKTLSSSLFMFFTSVAPAITFAAVLNAQTKEDGVSQLGPVEVLLSTALTGTIFSVLGGQPLCIVGVTGPVTVFTLACFTLAQVGGIRFLPFYCWVQIWAAIMHMLLAVTNACRAITLVSRYSCETFGMLIATIYIVTGLQNLGGYFQSKAFAPALLSLTLGLGTAWLALTLSGARAWSILSRSARVAIADYAATIAVVLFCCVPYVGSSIRLTPYHIGEETNGTIATLEVPPSFAPTAGARAWLVDPSECPPWAIGFAVAPAFFLTVLFFFDHNVSSLLCQSPDFKLAKGTAYHWDFFVVGVQILITGMLGIPPVNGLIPQAPLHTDSLCDKEFRTEPSGRVVEVVVRCREQRVSNLAQALLIGCTLPVVSALGYLPNATLDGLFLYMGLASFAGNTFFERCVLFITDKERTHARSLGFLGKVPPAVVRHFTLLQLIILGCIFVITRIRYVDGLFPLLIAVLVPVRLYVLPRIFGVAHVDAMDAAGAEPDEKQLEVEAVGKGASAKDSSDMEVQVTPPTPTKDMEVSFESV